MPNLPIWVYALIVSGLFNVGAGLWGWHELDRARVAEATLLTRTGERNAAVDANTTNQTTIAELRKANDANKQIAEGMTKAAKVLTDKVNAIAGDLAASEAKANELRRKLYASDAKLREWGSRPVPDVLGDVLRDRWRSASGPNGNGDGGTGPVRGAPGGSDGAPLRADAAGAVVDAIARRP